MNPYHRAAGRGTARALTLMISLAGVLAVPTSAEASHSGPTADGDMWFEPVNATTLRVCGSGAVDGSAVASTWTLSVTGARSNGTLITSTAGPAGGATFGPVCLTVSTQGAYGSGGAMLTFTGASTGGNVTTLCAAPLVFTPASFPYPIADACTNPSSLAID